MPRSARQVRYACSENRHLTPEFSILTATAAMRPIIHSPVHVMAGRIAVATKAYGTMTSDFEKRYLGRYALAGTASLSL